MDGVPVFNLARETLPAVSIEGFRGVVNTTTNFILSAMEEGRQFDAALSEMQAAGIAEADASLDVDGWDAAAKTSALANVLLGARMTPADVDRDGIGRISRAARRSAPQRTASQARRRGERDGRGVAASVAAGRAARARSAGAARPRGELAAAQDGPSRRDCDRAARLGLTQTAYALLSDVLTIARSR